MRRIAVIATLGAVAGCGGDPAPGVPLPEDARVEMVRRECIENDGPKCFRGFPRGSG